MNIDPILIIKSISLLFIISIILYKKENSLYKAFAFIFIFLATFGLFISISNDCAATVALILGLMALFKSLILKYFFPPILKLSIREIDSVPQQKIIAGEEFSETKWYNLSIKNNSFSNAKDIQVKIREDNNREWISLVRPFSEKLREQGIEWLKIDLSSREDEDFNIGFIIIKDIITLKGPIKKDVFYLYNNINPYNQDRKVEKEEKTFYLKITSKDFNTLFYKLNIRHDNFNQFNTSNIDIKKYDNNNESQV
ncbi:MAG: hypothetical protein PHI91_02060 [Candidatus Pacebacteria bacterium]|nr:hypothetical protein [Candidatus Paceibacterota bacterium]MDD4737715.1 hypothetical protein [Candidatus Paceibacterota bacterium]